MKPASVATWNDRVSAVALVDAVVDGDGERLLREANFCPAVGDVTVGVVSVTPLTVAEVTASPAGAAPVSEGRAGLLWCRPW